MQPPSSSCRIILSDREGRRAAPLRVSLPFQTVETVNESAQQRQRMLDLFSAGRDPDWRNRLIWDDKKYVLPSLIDEFARKVNLIYINYTNSYETIERERYA